MGNKNISRTSAALVLLCASFPNGTHGFGTETHPIACSKNPTTRFPPLRVSQYNGPLDSGSRSATTNEILDKGLSDLEFEEMIVRRNREMLQQAEEEHVQLYKRHLLQKKGQQQHYSEEELGESLFQTTRPSFKNVESMSERLFAQQPVIALFIFVGAGLLVAYLLGIFFLGGYMSSMNPALNGDVPYWDEEVPTEEDQILLLNSLYDVKVQNKLPSLWFW